jgi:putative flippase GtrA
LFNVLVLTVLDDGQLKATVLATIAATASSYFMNRHWTFRDRSKSAMRRESLLFFFFNAAGLLIELGVLALAKYGLNIHGLIALNLVKGVGLVLGMTFRFWAYRTFVFRPAVGAEHPHRLDPVAEIVEALEEAEQAEEHVPAPPQVPAQARTDRDDFDELDAELAAEVEAARTPLP